MIDCSKNTDQDIIEMVSGGDIDAFFCIVEKYEDKLFRYISRISSFPKEEIENILQEVFIKVYKNINAYNKKYSFSSWIYRIAHNHTLDIFRKHKNIEHISLENDDAYTNLIDMGDSGSDIEKEMHTKELNQQIYSILQSLDIKYKEVLILKFLEEKDYEEISDILHLPTGTVATLINRGKKQFLEKARKSNLSIYIK